MRHIQRLLAVVLVAVLGLVSWGGDGIKANSSDSSPVFRTMDDKLYDVGARVPEFGGVYFDASTETLMIYATDPVQVSKQSLESTLTEVFGTEVVRSGGIQMIQGQYSILQLKQWYEPMNKIVLTIPGVTGTDLWEGQNRLWVGVHEIHLKAKVEEELNRLGIPPEAVVIEKSAYFVEDTHTVQDASRPAVDAGVKIFNPNLAGGTGGYCTIGFSTTRNDWDIGMITVHHCTTIRAGVDHNPFHQPVANGNQNLIGTEEIDPPFFTNAQNSSCPVGKSCRRSQGSFVRKTGTLPLNQGYIARTTSQWGSLVIDHNKPTFRIKSESASIEGETVHKVGQFSGWTNGQVLRTCRNVPLSLGSNILYLCQDIANYWTEQGDSGSPVFRRDSSNPDEVHLLGVHWGKNPDNEAERVFSSVGLIYYDLGPFDTWKACDQVLYFC